MDYYDSTGNRVILGSEFNSGGEGTLYPVQPNLLAKIYKDEELTGNQRKERKLTWMVANRGTTSHIPLAWPTALLYDDQRQFVGYLMPLISNPSTLLRVWTAIYRKKYLSHFTQRHFFRTARNICTALSALHVLGHVIGDLNDGGILVMPDASIALVDTDSFQFIASKAPQQVIHDCTVGKGEYLAPELHGCDLENTRRFPEHDYFALGVLICRLLVKGSHPFRAQWLGNGNFPSLENRIRDGCFPYMLSPPCFVAPPNKDRLDQHLPPRLFKLAVRCFVDGHNKPRLRPTPDEWGQALAEAEQALLYKQAMTHFGAEEWSEAIKLLEEIIAIGAPYRDSTQKLQTARREQRLLQQYKQAKTLYDQEEYAEACRIFKLLLKKAPHYKDVATLLTEAQEQLDLAQLYQQAKASLDQAKASPDEHKFVLARDEFQQLFQKAPDYKDVKELLNQAEYRLALEYRKNKKFSRARTILQSLLLRPPHHKEALALQKIVELYIEGIKASRGRPPNWEKAIESFEKLIELEPNNQEAKDYLAQAKKKWQQALRPQVDTIRQAIWERNDEKVASQYRRLNQQAIQVSGLSKEEQEEAEQADQRFKALEEFRQARHPAQRVHLYDKHKSLLDPCWNFTLHERSEVREARRTLLLDELRQAIRRRDNRQIREAGEKAIQASCLLLESDWKAMAQAEQAT